MFAAKVLHACEDAKYSIISCCTKRMTGSIKTVPFRTLLECQYLRPKIEATVKRNKNVHFLSPAPPYKKTNVSETCLQLRIAAFYIPMFCLQLDIPQKHFVWSCYSKQSRP